jgi:hypothetical protein
MKRFLPVVFCLACVLIVATAATQDVESPPTLAVVPAATASDANTVGIRFWLYRIRGDISGDTSLTENVQAGIDDKKPTAKLDSVSLFTLAKLTLAGVRLQADQNGWKWDGKDEPPGGSRVEQIAAPRILLNMPNTFFIQIGSDSPIQYLRKRSDGLFELAQVSQPAGLKVTARVEKGKGGADTIVLSDFSIETSLVEKRKPIEGVALDVGEPVLKVNESRLTIAVKPNQDYGILSSTEGVGSLLMRLRLDTKTQ